MVAAVDINNVANDVYRHNFPNANLMQRAIEVSEGQFCIEFILVLNTILILILLSSVFLAPWSFFLSNF